MFELTDPFRDEPVPRPLVPLVPPALPVVDELPRIDSLVPVEEPLVLKSVLPLPTPLPLVPADVPALPVP